MFPTATPSTRSSARKFILQHTTKEYLKSKGLNWPHGTTKQYQDMFDNIIQVKNLLISAATFGAPTTSSNVLKSIFATGPQYIQTVRDFKIKSDTVFDTGRRYQAFRNQSDNIEFPFGPIEPEHLFTQTVDLVVDPLPTLPTGLYNVKLKLDLSDNREEDIAEFITALSLSGDAEDIELLNRLNMIFDITTESITPKLLNMLYPFSVSWIDFINNIMKDESLNYKINFTINELSPVRKNPLTQTFKDNKTSDCVFQLIRDKYPKNRAAKKLLAEFPDGVPENKLQYIADKTRITIKIVDIMMKPYKTYKPLVSSRGTVTACNQSKNHLDIFNPTPIECTKQDLLNILEEDKPHIKHKHNGQLVKIQNGDGVFRVSSTNFDFIYDFEQSINIKRIALPHSEISKFIRYGYIMPNSKTFKSGDAIELDQVKSFTQHKQCSYYEQFPSLINAFCPTDDIKGVGYYLCDIIAPDNHRLIELGWVTSIKVVPSPVIKFLRDNNYIINISFGAWSYTPFDFDYNDSMLASTCDITPYKVWAGTLAKTQQKMTYHFHGDYDWASHIANLGYDIYTDYNADFYIKSPKYKQHTYIHVAGFITAYSHIHMMQQFLTIPQEHIYKVVMDGIYIDVNYNPTILPTWKYKYVKSVHHEDANNDFLIHRDAVKYTNCNNIIWSYPTLKYQKQYYLFNGPGGSGKTTEAMKHIPNHLYVVDSYQGFGEHTGLVLARLLSNSYISRLVYHPPTIILDECTKYLNRLDRIKTMYPYSQLIFIGDLDEDNIPYQLGTIKYNKPFDTSVDEIITFTTDYRAKCDELKRVKKHLRTLTTIKQVRDYILTQVPVITKEQIVDEYTADDYIVSPTKICKLCKQNRCEHSFDEHKNMSKYFTDNILSPKYLITKNSREYNNGQYVTTKPDIPDGHYHREQTHTIHSVQGRTIESKVYIILDRLFDYRQVYVAVSRVRYLSQLSVLYTPIDVSDLIKKMMAV